MYGGPETQSKAITIFIPKAETILKDKLKHDPGNQEKHTISKETKSNLKAPKTLEITDLQPKLEGTISAEAAPTTTRQVKVRGNATSINTAATQPRTPGITMAKGKLTQQIDIGKAESSTENDASNSVTIPQIK